MVAVVFVTIATFLYGTFVGWVFHWVLHQRWSGLLYRSHTAHHLNYPATDLLSSPYRDTGKNNGLLFFVPAIAVAMLFFFAGLYLLGFGWPVFAWVFVESIAIGTAHEWLHVRMHLSDPVYMKSNFFRKVRLLHFYHHRNVKKNLGIFWFGWDRLFNTYRPLRG